MKKKKFNYIKEYFNFLVKLVILYARALDFSVIWMVITIISMVVITTTIALMMK